MSLLEKAMAVKSARSRSNHDHDERMELSLAWARGEVALAQVTTAIGLDSRSATAGYIFLAQGLRDLVQAGKLIEAEDSKKE